MTSAGDNPDVFGNTIFCDDIRFEIDNKITYIGCYGPRMFVHTPFPCVLPKFGFGITLFQRKKVATLDFSIKIFLPGDPDDKATFDLHQPPNTPMPPEDDNAEFMIAAFNSIATPLPLKEPGSIRVRAYMDDRIYRVGSMRVLASTQPGALAAAAQRATD